MWSYIRSEGSLVQTVAVESSHEKFDETEV